MRQTIIMSGVLCLISGCKTGGVGSLKEVANETTAGGLHCLFESPIDSGETLEAWMAAPSGGSLQNVKTLQRIRGEAQPSQSLSLAPAVGKAEVTNNGRRELRSCYKAIVDVDFKDFDCFNLESDSSRVSFLCLGKGEAAQVDGGQKAFWATNLARQRYLNELTIFESSCQAK